jgi:ribonuclease R
MSKRINRRRTAKDEDAIFHKKILAIFEKSPYQYFNYKQAAAQIGVSSDEEKEKIRKGIAQMLQNNVLVEGNRGKYKLNPVHVAAHAGNCIEGKISMKQTGKAYLISTDPSVEDIFIAANNTLRALDGDIVRVHLFPSRKDRRTEGRVVEILKRNKEFFVGTVKKSANMSYFIADNTSMPIDILIPNKALNGAKNGQKVVVSITEWSEHARNPFGEVKRILGFPGNNDVEMMSIVLDQSFTPEFPDAVEKASRKLASRMTPKEIASRRDFRNIFTLTIDPADAKDFDDAISFRPLANDRYEVGVHIADVSHYVRQGDIVDQEAFHRATSIYLVDRTIPMLPESLSNDICSLRPNEDKLCFSAVFELNANGKIFKQWIGKTVIHSNHRFNYEEVQQIIEAKEGLYVEEILMLDKIAKALRADRFKHGSINFATEEVKFILDEKSKPIGVYLKEDKDSNRLIEDFMLLANRKVAELIGKTEQGVQAKPFVYRIHDKPRDEKINKFNVFINKLGYNLKLNSRKSLVDSMNRLFDTVQGKGEQNMIETLALRTMQRAIYSTDNIGHYGLSFKHYTHFTSPIRRYPDLMVHRLLEQYMKGKPAVNKEELEAKCTHSSNMEQRATEAERTSVKYKQAEYLSDKIGQQFEGLISGVSKWGVWVELAQTKCEGMISIKSFTDDFYYYDEENYRYIGQHTGKTYRLGDKVQIVVKAVNLAKKQMDFVFAK